MTTWHLELIEKRIQQMGWQIVDKVDGDDYTISGSWIVRRKTERKLDFEGFDDLDVKPMDQSYGCQIKGTEVGLYFHRRGRAWDKALTESLKQLNELD